MPEEHHVAVLRCDDTLSREIALRVHAGQYDRDIELLKSRTFHIWEGGARFGVHESWVDAHLLRGCQRFAANKFNDALADFQTVFEYPENLQTARPRRGGRNPEVLFWIGTAWEALGQTGKARSFWKESAAAFEGGERGAQPQLYYRARSLEKLGGRDKAAIYRGLVAGGTEALRKGAAVDYFAKFGERQSHRSRIAQAHYITGPGCLGLGDAARAAGHFRNAITESPEHLGAHANLDALK